MQKHIRQVIKAIKQFDLIQEGDIVTVGVSGGKDSMLTVTLLHEISKFYNRGERKEIKTDDGVRVEYEKPPYFRVVGVSLDCTGGEAEKSGAYQPTKDYFKKHGMELHIVPVDVIKIVFDDRKEKNPCSLCANLRRGRLNAYANEIGSKKVALGHHADDLMETFFLNMLYGGRLAGFEPKTYFSRADITQIRPMIYLKESEIIALGKKLGIPILDNCCTVNGKTQRQFMKYEIERFERILPGAKTRIFRSVMSLYLDNEKGTAEDSSCNPPLIN